MIEEWLPVEGFEDKYLVSNMGRVWGIKRGHELKQQNYKGYKKVMLSVGYMNLRFVWLHRLVAKAFCPGYFEGADVNHKDFNPSNNIYTNLEWVSHKDNILHSYKAGRMRPLPKNYGGYCWKKGVEKTTKKCYNKQRKLTTKETK